MSNNILASMESNSFIQTENKIIYKTDSIKLEINTVLLSNSTNLDNNIKDLINLLNSIEKNTTENIQQYNLQQIKKHEETKYVFV
jgi:hypothetical protein